MNAKKISNYLLFLEYELQSLLLNKDIKIKDILVLKLQVSAEERFIIGMTVDSAVYLMALPPPKFTLFHK